MLLVMMAGSVKNPTGADRVVVCGLNACGAGAAVAPNAAGAAN
jgi:hypothetical protein